MIDVALALSLAVCGPNVPRPCVVDESGYGPVPAPLFCPPGTVPGWLDEHGAPTSCVNNDPHADWNPAGIPPELAFTGPREDAILGWLIVGGVAVSLGVGMVLVARRPREWRDR